jgi:hypothetical protein
LQRVHVFESGAESAGAAEWNRAVEVNGKLQTAAREQMNQPESSLFHRGEESMKIVDRRSLKALTGF